MSFNPDEQRDEHGRWTAGGGDVYAQPGDKTWAIGHGDIGGPMVALTNLDNASSARSLASLATQLCKEEGFPPVKIKIVDSEYKFNVNGKEMTAAGLAYADTGLIELYVRPGGANSPGMAGVIVHEIMHQKYNAWMEDVKAAKQRLDAVYEQYKAGGRTDGRTERDYWKEVQHADGSLVEPYASDPKFSIYGKNDKLTFDYAQMEKEDGCSNYSKEYWEAFMKGGGSGYDRRKAIHETLAEMARLDYEKKHGLWRQPGDLEMGAPPMLKKNGFLTVKPSKRWTALYKAVNANYKKRSKE